jgi:hypothetical protein
MAFDLVGSKIMTFYVAEIKGRGVAAFHANNGSDAERLVRDRVFRDDLMVLATEHRRLSATTSCCRRTSNGCTSSRRWTILKASMM